MVFFFVVKVILVCFSFAIIVLCVCVFHFFSKKPKNKTNQKLIFLLIFF